MVNEYIYFNRTTYQAFQWVSKVLLLLSATLLYFSYAYAQDSITTSVSAAYYYDSNLFRLSDDEAKQQPEDAGTSDVIRRIGGSLKARIPLSRQLLNVNAAFQNVKFNRFDYLDYTGGNAEVSWDWRVGKHWNGDVGMDYLRTQPNYGELQIVERDIRTKSGVRFNLHYDPSPSIRARATLKWSDGEHSADQLKVLNRQVRRVESEIRYLSSARSYLGIRFTFSDISYPERLFIEGSFIDNGFNDSSISLTLRTRPTRKTTLEGWVGYTLRSYSNLSSKNYDGYTGRLKHIWSVSHKVQVVSTVWGDFDPVDDGYSNQIVKTGLNLIPTWSMTEKIALQGLASYEIRDYSNFNANTASSREDAKYTIGGSLNYAMYRSLRFGIALRSEKRNSSTEKWSYKYDYAMMSMTVTI